MDFSKRQADPRRHLVGIAFVIALHVAIVYALMTGLSKKVIEVVRAPIETKLIEEVRTPPPPQEVVLPPTPRMEAPPPPFIPPPEVQIQAPPPAPQPTITAVTPTPPPAPVVVAPVAPPVVAPAPPAPAPPAPAPTPAVSVACPAYRNVLIEAGFPPEASRQGVERGDVVVGFTVTANNQIKDVEIVSSTHRAFNRSSIAAVRRFECNSQGREVKVTVPIAYSMSH